MKLFVGGFIALILLGIYAYSVTQAILLAYSQSRGALTSGELLALTTVGGLVSALVIAELAISKPGGMPSHRISSDSSRSSAFIVRAADNAAPFVVFVYIGVWTMLGAAAFIVGVMQYPDRVPALTDFGQSWLGLAVAAGYAYFGLNRDQ